MGFNSVVLGTSTGAQRINEWKITYTRRTRKVSSYKTICTGVVSKYANMQSAFQWFSLRCGKSHMCGTASKLSYRGLYSYAHLYAARGGAVLRTTSDIRTATEKSEPVSGTKSRFQLSSVKIEQSRNGVPNFEALRWLSVPLQRPKFERRGILSCLFIQLPDKTV